MRHLLDQQYQRLCQQQAVFMVHSNLQEAACSGLRCLPCQQGLVLHPPLQAACSELHQPHQQ